MTRNPEDHILQECLLSESQGMMNILQKLKTLGSPASEPARIDNLRLQSAAQGYSVLDEYVRTAPSDQNALDIFQGEWASAVPGLRPPLRSGQVPVFVDPKVRWALEQFGGVKDRTVLELGPLEGAHSYMLEQAGARSVLAVEANRRAYLKCLIVKEIMQLKNVRFVLGDCMAFLDQTVERYDVCLASGLLYHMQDPVGLIARIAPHTDSLFIWTHYYDDSRLRVIPYMFNTFKETETGTRDGFQYRYYKHLYGDNFGQPYFLGGMANFSCWMERDEILRCLTHYGFKKIETNFEDPNHAAGPSFALVARRV